MTQIIKVYEEEKKSTKKVQILSHIELGGEAKKVGVFIKVFICICILIILYNLLYIYFSLQRGI